MAVMMMLGAYPFMLSTAAYQQLKRSSQYRWKQQNRVGRMPAQQFIGAGADQITLRGEILPEWKGGHRQLGLMRTQAKFGRPLIMIDGGGGFVLDRWVILKIEETRSELLPNGRAQVIQFSMTLKQYGEDLDLSPASLLSNAVSRLL